MELIIVGSGVSTAIPIMGHLSDSCACYDAIHTPNSKNRRNNVSIMLHKIASEETLAKIGPAPSDREALGRWVEARMAQDTNVLFDAGKTLRDAYFNILVKHNVVGISALLITHDHADACGGMDDMRDLQPVHLEMVGGIEKYRVLRGCPTFLSHTTLRTLDRQVPYILNHSRFLNGVLRDESALSVSTSAAAPPPASHSAVARYDFPAGSAAATAAQFEQQLSQSPSIGLLDRRVTSLDVVVIDDAGPQQLFIPSLDFPIFSFPVFHGYSYISMAYAFGPGLAFRKDLSPSDLAAIEAPRPSVSGNDDIALQPMRSVLYISDVSAIPDVSQTFLNSLAPVDVLIVDMLLGPGEKHFSHYCFDDVVALVDQLQPRWCLGVGMHCTLEHAATNQSLAQVTAGRKAAGQWARVERIELAYDGLTLRVADA